MLNCQSKGYKDRITLDNNIIKEHVRNPGDQNLHYNIKKCIKQGVFDILHDISEKITLVQIMDSVINVNHAVSIFGYWIFDSRYKKTLPLTLYSLNIICFLR